MVHEVEDFTVRKPAGTAVTEIGKRFSKEQGKEEQHGKPSLFPLSVTHGASRWKRKTKWTTMGGWNNKHNQKTHSWQKKKKVCENIGIVVT